MTCFSAKRNSTAYVDGRLRGSEHSRVTSHVRGCERCASYFDQVAILRKAVRSIPQATPPVQLETALRVIASRERKSMLQNRGSRLAAWWNRWSLEVDLLMRPLTVPATGGLLSSMILFGVLAFTIGTTTRVVGYEVPVLYESRADANLVPFELRSKAVMVNISLDASGRIRDYSMGDGSYSVEGNLARLQYNTISMPEFPSVLALAHPITGDVRILFTPLALRP